MVNAQKSPRILAKRPLRNREPLEVRLTVQFKFGEEAEDVVKMMDDRRIPMVDSVFKSRQRIVRAFALLLVKAASLQPKVAKEIVPLLKFVARRGKRRSK